MTGASGGEARRVVEQFWETQKSGDYTELVDLFAADAVVEDPIWGTYRGRESIMAFLAKMVAETTRRKIRFSVKEIAGDEEVAWARWTMHAPGGDRDGVGIYKVRDGLLTFYRDNPDPREVEEITG